MIPLRDINPTYRFPAVTVTIIGLNVAVYLIELLFQFTGQLDNFFLSYAVIPYELTRGVDLPPPSLHPAFLTIFTAMFMHGGFLHIAGNMLYLWIFGNNVEDDMGHLRFLVFYLICGIAATMAQVLVNPASTVPNIGASGAIAGVLAAYLIMHPRAQVETLLFLGYFIRIIRLPAIIVLGFWIVIQLFQGVLSLGVPQSGGVAWFAHIGGFIAGLVLVNVFRQRVRRTRWDI
ncbi:MAG: rhomboid family intramembrane serine protease [Chloroflexi bacterium]|nr:MAG: rhomboid family intramembrane serine protease [Chloroflexota bacterium]